MIIWLALAAVSVALFATPARAQPADLQTLLDERALVALADGLDADVDAKAWDRVRAAFTDEIDVDLSAAGGPNARMPADELVGAWRTNLFEAKTSFHLRGNHRVTLSGDRATMTSVAYAWNRLPGLEGGDLWEVWGTYSYDFARTPDGWRMASFAFVPTHQRGNAAVPTAPAN